MRGRIWSSASRPAAWRGGGPRPASTSGCRSGKVDERGFAVAAGRSARAAGRPSASSLGRFKEIVREQFLLLRLDEERAIAALPKLLPDDERAREAALDVLRRVIAARGALPDEGSRRLERIEALFGVRRRTDEAGDAAHG